jgi:predicted nucleotidyltransferase
MLSVARERPVAPMALEVLTLVDRIARELALDYFVTGAMARDILLYGIFGLDPGRATLDVDLAVALNSWPQFDVVKARLVETGAFTPDGSKAHRLFYRGSTRQRSYPLDLLPFGGIEQRPNEIAWPPDLSIVMNVAGYREALATAQEVEVHSDLVVRVASLPALAILKLFAWADRGAENPKDALDLATLLRRYGAAGNEDRLFVEEIGLLEALSYNMDLAGPRLLGKDAARATMSRPVGEFSTIAGGGSRASA